MKKVGLWLALAGLMCVSKSSAASLDDVQFWIGSGTNRAALVVEWSTPESFGPSTVPAPIANKSLVWGYRFNGSATGTQMLKAILAADQRLHVVADLSWGTYVQAIGYTLAGGGAGGITDGSNTDFFTTNYLTSTTANIDAAAPLNPGDLYWGGVAGPNWEVWTELGAAGGLLHSPARGTDQFWTPDNPNEPWSGVHGQWELAQLGLDGLSLTNGSWIGFSVAAGELDFFSTPITGPFYVHKHAPGEPDTGITALVKNFGGGWRDGQWQAHFASCTNWLYSLERSSDLQNWTVVTNGISGNGTNLITADPAPPADKAFYRVRAEHP